MRKTSMRAVTRRLCGGVALSAPAVCAPRTAGRAATVPSLDVVVDAREEHREEGGRHEPPDLHEDEPETSGETAAHAPTLARSVPGGPLWTRAGAQHAPSTLDARRTTLQRRADRRRRAH